MIDIKQDKQYNHALFNDASAELHQILISYLSFIMFYSLIIPLWFVFIFNLLRRKTRIDKKN